jgi:hypothetical protein
MGSVPPANGAAARRAPSGAEMLLIGRISMIADAVKRSRRLKSMDRHPHLRQVLINGLDFQV